MFGICDQVSHIVSDAKFILLVEKDAAFMRLAEDRFYNAYPCIIITAKGQPDVASRCGCSGSLHTRRSPAATDRMQMRTHATKCWRRPDLCGVPPAGLG